MWWWVSEKGSKIGDGDAFLSDIFSISNIFQNLLNFPLEKVLFMIDTNHVLWLTPRFFKLWWLIVIDDDCSWLMLIDHDWMMIIQSEYSNLSRNHHHSIMINHEGLISFIGKLLRNLRLKKGCNFNFPDCGATVLWIVHNFQWTYQICSKSSTIIYPKIKNSLCFS